jgi:hypothetical protein
MNIKLHEIINLYYELNGLTKTEGQESETMLQGLLKQKTSLKVKMYLQRLNKIVSEEVKLYEDAKKELYEKHGEKDGDTITISKENIESFNQDLNDLLTAEKDIEVSALWGSDLTIENLESIETDEFYPTLFKLIDK